LRSEWGERSERAIPTIGSTFEHHHVFDGIGGCGIDGAPLVRSRCGAGTVASMRPVMSRGSLDWCLEGVIDDVRGCTIVRCPTPRSRF
jgi:hypothetical protein